jgi:hypothetical protein
LIGYGNERRHITAGVVAKAITELLNVPQSKRLFIGFAGFVIVCIVLSLKYSDWMSGKQSPSAPILANFSSVNTPKHTITSNTESPKATSELNQQFLRLQEEILSYDQNDFHLLAFNAIAKEWNGRPITIFNGKFKIPSMYSRLAAKRNLRVTTFKGTLDDVIRFDLPFIVLTKVPGSLGGYCLAVTSIKNNSISISPPLFDSSTLSKNDLNSIATGTFYLIWQNTGQIPDNVNLGDNRSEIRTLQLLLQKAGTYNDVLDGNYGTATVKAVVDFQRLAGVSRDETVGELSLAALSKYYTVGKVPSISSTGSTK